MSKPFDKFSDPFAPPRTPCVVCCMHCGSTYDSWRILWRDMPGEAVEGAWCCPIPGCDGVGFGFDIHPVEAENEATEPDDLPFDEAEDEEEFSLEAIDAFEGFSDDEDEAEADEDEPSLPIDEFDEHAFWIDPQRIAPRSHGNTPQAPFDRAPYGYTNSSDLPLKDDDIPF
jgi:hypothetical protein